MPDDPFAVLGVPAGASDPEIAEAYRALAQIYHPDRYAEAPARVQAEATRRMQAVNEAFEQLRRGAASQPATAPRGRPASRPPAEPPLPLVHYVDGAKGFHNGDVAPLGFAKVGAEVQRVSGATRCARLDDELRAWFEQQQRNADLAAQQLYQSWDDEERDRYAATLGCTQVVRPKAVSLGVPCGVCRA
jgi:hypothetical protein